MRNVELYVRPRSAQEAVQYKQQYGENAVYLAGGTDLLVHRPESVTVAIDIRYTGLAKACEQDGDFVIGGATRLRDAERAAHGIAGGMLRHAFRETAPWLIRNTATVSGNVANASPAADSVPALMALDATLQLLGDSEESVSIADVFERPHHTTLGNRLITGITIPARARSRRGAFIKLARSASDIALVNIAVSFRQDDTVMRDVRVALGAVAPVPVRARSAESVLEGQELAPDIIARAAEAVTGEIAPISDWRASAEYRRRMSGVLLRRAVLRASGAVVEGVTV